MGAEVRHTQREGADLRMLPSLYRHQEHMMDALFFEHGAQFRSRFRGAYYVHLAFTEGEATHASVGINGATSSDKCLGKAPMCSQHQLVTFQNSEPGCFGTTDLGKFLQN